MRRLLVRTAIAAFAIAGLGACVTIPERAWANGQGMTATKEYRMKMNGDIGFETQRALYVKSSPISLWGSSPVRFPARNYDR